MNIPRNLQLLLPLPLHFNLENYYFDPFQRHINLIKRKNVQNPKNKHNRLFIFQLSYILT